MQTSELKSSLVCSTSEIQRWISKDFITGLVSHSLVQTYMVQQAVLYSHQNHSQLRVSLHKLFREKIAQVFITWLINTEKVVVVVSGEPTCLAHCAASGPAQRAAPASPSPWSSL